MPHDSPNSSSLPSIPGSLRASSPAVAPAVSMPLVSAHVPDWAREGKSFWSWHPSRSLLASLRAYERAAGGRSVGAAVSRKLAALRHRFWSIVTGADIPLGCRLGGGLLLPHPNGVVIHPGTCTAGTEADALRLIAESIRVALRAHPRRRRRIFPRPCRRSATR